MPTRERDRQDIKRRNSDLEALKYLANYEVRRSSAGHFGLYLRGAKIAVGTISNAAVARAVMTLCESMWAPARIQRRNGGRAGKNYREKPRKQVAAVVPVAALTTPTPAPTVTVEIPPECMPVAYS